MEKYQAVQKLLKTRFYTAWKMLQFYTQTSRLSKLNSLLWNIFKRLLCKLHPFIFFSHFFPSVYRELMQQSVWEAGQVTHPSLSHLRDKQDNLNLPANLKCIVLICGRKPENQGKPTDLQDEYANSTQRWIVTFLLWGNR